MLCLEGIFRVYISYFLCCRLITICMFYFFPWCHENLTIIPFILVTAYLVSLWNCCRLMSQVVKIYGNTSGEGLLGYGAFIDVAADSARLREDGLFRPTQGCWVLVLQVIMVWWESIETDRLCRLTEFIRKFIFLFNIIVILLSVSRLCRFTNACLVLQITSIFEWWWTVLAS